VDGGSSTAWMAPYSKFKSATKGRRNAASEKAEEVRSKTGENWERRADASLPSIGLHRQTCVLCLVQLCSLVESQRNGGKQISGKVCQNVDEEAVSTCDKHCIFRNFLQCRAARLFFVHYSDGAPRHFLLRQVGGSGLSCMHRVRFTFSFFFGAAAHEQT
jgi:hypothetical protein